MLLKDKFVHRTKQKSTTALVLFTTTLITISSIISFFLAGIYHSSSGNYSPIFGMFALVIINMILSLVVSSLIIDRILNPIRIMTKNIKAIGERNFEEKLVLHTKEDELKEYVIVFNEMVDKLNSYIQKQKRFVSDASHELATPLAIINGHINLILRWGKKHEDILETELNIIKKEVLGMDSLIESLLFFARSDSNRMEYSMEALDLSSICRKIISEYRQIHKDFIFSEVIDLSCTMYGDKEALIRTLRIILSNAIKYSQEKKEINFSLIKEQNKIILEITDYGIGIPEDDIDKVFERFYRVDDSRTKGTGGTGLGLAIAKEIIQAHKGHITAESEKGTTIRIQLPIFMKTGSTFIPLSRKI